MFSPSYIHSKSTDKFSLFQRGHTIMAEFIAVILITILAVVSPGADFAIVTKNSYLYGRKIGVFTSLGISLGVLVHVTYTLVAVAFVMTYTPQILNIVKYIGALYLIYIGYKTFTQKPVLDTAALTSLGTLQAIKYGFFTNALNPKTTLFVISTYTQIVSLTTPKSILLVYGFLCLCAFHMVFTGGGAVLINAVETKNVSQASTD